MVSAVVQHLHACHSCYTHLWLTVLHKHLCMFLPGQAWTVLLVLSPRVVQL